MRPILIAALALTLASCQPTPPAAPATDLTPAIEAITTLDQQVTVLAANVDVLTARVVALDDRVSDRLTTLIGAATDLNALVQQPLSVADVDLTTIEGLVVTTTPDAIDFLLITPGECPTDLPNSRTTYAGGELLVSTFWPAPTGPHCISSAGNENHAAFGVPIDVPAGTIGSVTLLPPE